MDLTSFSVVSVVIHQVPAVRVAVKPLHAPRLSEIPSTLDAPRRNYFREKITQSLTSGAFAVVRDPDQPSPVPQLILDFFADDTKLVAGSRDIALHLYSSQSGNNSDGLLAVIAGTLDDAPCLAVLKLEEERGVQILEVQVNGQLTFDVELLDGLTLTEGTRVFKASVFPYAADLASLRGSVSDNQRGFKPLVAVAGFFLTAFLGCRLESEPQVATKEFFDTAEGFFNSLEATSATRYEVALLAEMHSNRQTIRARQFAQDFLDVEHRDPFVALFKLEDGSVPQIHKDTELISNRIDRLVMEFSNGLSLRGPREALNDVTVNDQSDPPETVIRSDLRRVTGR